MYNETQISALLAWNADNNNIVGLQDIESESELKKLIEGGLDPMEFITEEDLYPYK
jgi:hypothetical protein